MGQRKVVGSRLRQCGASAISDIHMVLSRISLSWDKADMMCRCRCQPHHVGLVYVIAMSGLGGLARLGAMTHPRPGVWAPNVHQLRISRARATSHSRHGYRDMLQLAVLLVNGVGSMGISIPRTRWMAQV